MPMPAPAPAADLEVGGYRLDEAAANDDLGIVYRAHHVESRRPALVWILSPLAGDADVVGYLEGELRAVARLDNPRVLASGRVLGLPYVVTDDAGPEWIAAREDVSGRGGEVRRLAAWAAAGVVAVAAVLAGVLAVGHAWQAPANGGPAAVAPAPGGAAAGTPVPGASSAATAAPGAAAPAPRPSMGIGGGAIRVPDAGDEREADDDGGGSDRG